jgi:CRISPR-associated protein Csa3
VTVQIVFVGHHKERLLESIRALREYPVSKIILAVGQQDTSMGKLTQSFNDMQNYFSSISGLEVEEE